MRKPMPTTPEPLIVTRHFRAPRELVFKAFSTAEHIKQWFSPAGLTTPEAEVDFRAGGVFAVCMRFPNGTDNWSRGTFTEVSPNDRIVFAGAVGEPDDVKFSTVTTITLADTEFGTRMNVHQSYEIYDEAFLAAVAGASEGWRTTLDKLERLTDRMTDLDACGAVHDSFTLERTLDASPARAFAAFTTPQGKQKWFHGPPGWVTTVEAFDVRPGGRERAVTRSTDGVAHTFEAVYFDVERDRRLVYAYEMHLDARRISVSLATVEFTPDGAGTHLKITEQGVFLNGYDDAGSRERGTRDLLDRIVASLES
jgi:uncharacterized protein YndB with AHSA1/START domain